MTRAELSSLDQGQPLVITTKLNHNLFKVGCSVTLERKCHEGFVEVRSGFFRDFVRCSQIKLGKFS